MKDFQILVSERVNRSSQQIHTAAILSFMSIPTYSRRYEKCIFSWPYKTNVLYTMAMTHNLPWNRSKQSISSRWEVWKTYPNDFCFQMPGFFTFGIFSRFSATSLLYFGTLHSNSSFEVLHKYPVPPCLFREIYLLKSFVQGKHRPNPSAVRIWNVSVGVVGSIHSIFFL